MEIIEDVSDATLISKAPPKTLVYVDVSDALLFSKETSKSLEVKGKGNFEDYFDATLLSAI